MKQCSCCRKIKDFNDFHHSKHTKDGYTFWCKACQRQKYLENADIKKAYSKIYYQANRAEALAKNRARRLLNPELERQRDKQEWARFKQKKAESDKLYWEKWQGPRLPDNVKICGKCSKILPKDQFRVIDKNTHRLCSYCFDCENLTQKEYRAANPERYLNRERRGYAKRKLQRAAYRQTDKYAEWRKKYRSNPHVMIYDRLSQRIRRLIKNANTEKAASTMELIGCTREFLIEHLKKTLPSNVTWEQFLNKECDIDHIIPAVAYDLTNVCEQKACFNWKNLRILKSFDNRAKAARDKKFSSNNKNNKK